MSWTAIILIGWPLASLVGGPVIGRFVAIHLESPSQMPDRAQPAVAPSSCETEAVPFSDSVVTVET